MCVKKQRIIKVTDLKKTVIYILVFIMLFSYPAYNLFALSTSVKGGENEGSVKKGISIIEKLSSYDVKKAEKSVRKAEGDRTFIGTATVSQINSTVKKIEKGTLSYRKVFRNVCIVGDSLMNGLEAYNILNGNNLITQVSASLYHLNDNISNIVAMNPRVLILHYGINMISGNEAQLDSFIRTYTSHIKNLKKQLPDTRIIVSLLFPVKRSVAKAARFAYVDKYNKALVKMCNELKVESMDSSAVLKAHPECYGGDGIHLSKAFYAQHWLKFIIREKGIIG